LAQQLGLGLDYLKSRASPLPEPFGGCILLLSVATPGEPVVTFYVRRATLDAAWRAGTTQVRQWAWSRSLDCLELRIDWPLHISALHGGAPSASTQPAVSAWALADESLEQVQLVPPQRWPATAPAPNTWLPGSLPRAHWLLHLQGLFVDSEGCLTPLPRPVAAPLANAVVAAAPTTAMATAAATSRRSSLPIGEASLAMLQALAVPESALSPWNPEHLEAFCARLYALLLVQQHHQQQPGDSAILQRGLSQLLGRAALQLCQQIQQTQKAQQAQDQGQPHALCLLVLARYLQAHREEPQASLLPLMAQLAQRIAPSTTLAAHHDLQPPLPSPTPAALAPAWRYVALAAYADCLGSQASEPAQATLPAKALAAQRSDPPPSDAGMPAMASPEMAALEAMTRHWLQWHLLAHGGASTPLPDWSLIAVAELALQPGLATARRHLQSCSWLAALRKPLQTHLPQHIHPETAMFIAPESREQAAFIEPCTSTNPLQISSWRTYQWIHRIAVPQLINFD
jgi:hypothetical protein